MAIEGPLHELSLTDVFQLLDMSKKTGTLTIRADGRIHPATVRFERGGVVEVDVPDRRSSIGHRLLRAGKVTERQLELARRHVGADRPQPIGAVLARLGMVAETEVKRQLRNEIEELVCELVHWQDGYFRFDEGSVPLAEVHVRVPCESVLMEAARRMDEWALLRPNIPDMEVTPVLCTDGEAGFVLDLRPIDWEMLAEVDGRRTLREIATELGRGDFEVAKVAHGLASGGVIEILETPNLVPASTTIDEGLREVGAALSRRDYTRAHRLAERLLEERPDHAGLHLLSGRALLGLSRLPQALERLERAVLLDPLSADAHGRLAVAAARSGAFERAREAWEIVLRLSDLPASDRAEVARAAEAAMVLHTMTMGEAA